MKTRQRRLTEEELAVVRNSRPLTREQTAELGRRAPEGIRRILLAHGDIDEDGYWIGADPKPEWWPEPE